MRAIDGTHKARAEWSAREIKRELDSIEANMIANGEAGDDERDEDGNPVARIWLGTFFGVTPSGKMYAPWACSNVAGCNGCNGTGEQKIQSPRKRLARRRASARFEQLTRKRRRRAAARPEGRAFIWNDPRFATINAQAERTGDYMTGKRQCPVCDGTGSAEAAADERWQEEMERIAEEAGGYFTSNDDSYFIERVVDLPDAPEDESEGKRSFRP